MSNITIDSAINYTDCQSSIVPVTQAMPVNGPNGSQLEHPILFSPGQSLGDYRITALIGQGGMGVVYAAVDTRLERPVAIKTLAPKLLNDPHARSRFLQEARSQAKIEDDNVLNIHQVDEVDNVPFFVMPLLKGETLFQRLSRNKPLRTDETIRIGQEIAHGLAVAHACGLIHRDIKPSNIWLEERTHRVKILDFGLARSIESNEREHQTECGIVLGTSEYMSPEQARCQLIDPKTDQFSLGCLLYECITGVIPFQREDRASTIAAILRDDPKPPQDISRTVPKALSDLIVRLLSKSPEQRPSASEVANDLKLERQRTRQLFRPAVLGALTLAIVMVWLFLLPEVNLHPVVTTQGPLFADQLAQSTTPLMNPHTRKTASGHIVVGDERPLLEQLRHEFQDVEVCNTYDQPFHTKPDYLHDPAAIPEDGQALYIYGLWYPTPEFPKCPISESLIPRCEKMSRLNALHLGWDYSLTSDDLSRLSRTPVVNTIERIIANNQLTEEWLTELTKFPKVFWVGLNARGSPELWQALCERVPLYGVQLLGVNADMGPDAGWREVLKCDLASLYLRQFATIDVDATQQIAAMSRLHSLTILFSNYSLEALKPLSQCQKLRYINILSDCFTDDYARVLGGFAHLEDLKLDSCNLSDAGLLEFARIPTLKRLSIHSKLVTTKGINDFREARPDCVVIHQ